MKEIPPKRFLITNLFDILVTQGHVTILTWTEYPSHALV